MFGVVPKTLWNKTNPADENNLITLAMRCLLIEDAEKLILVDTGIGNKQSEKFFSRYFLHGHDSLEKSLNKLGFGVDDLTDIFLTHLHFDHVGGSVILQDEKLVPKFKFINPTDASFTGNISVLYANGHTDAMMLPKISYKNKTLVYMADLLPTVGHIPLPYIPAYDMFPLKSLAEKAAFLEEAADQNYILFLEHDPEIECCTVKKTEKGIRLNKTFKLNEI